MIIELGSVVTAQGENESFDGIVIGGPYYRIDRADGSAPSLVVAQQIQPEDHQPSLQSAVRRLRAEHRDDKAVEAVFIWLNDFCRKRRETTVERASTATKLPEEAIKKVFRTLASVGLGRYVRGGRNGHKSRIQWNFPVSEIAAEFLGRR
jgi:hypothetical protein